MTVLETAPEDRVCDVPGGEPDPVADQISAALSRMVRHGARMKAELATALFGGVEMSALVVLHRLGEGGPQRAGELAERLQMDPSQVSRHVSTLVRHDLVVRRADPDDGRATQLVVTDRGARLSDRFTRARSGQVAAVVTGWEPGEAVRFADRLERFVDGMERLRFAQAGPGTDGPDPATPDQTTQTTRTTRADAATGTESPHVQAGATT